MEQRDHVIRTVLAAGFDRVGTLPLHAAGDPNLERWLAAGHHGAMGWMERQAAARKNPQSAFAGFRSAVVACLEYGEVAPAPRDPLIGNISRYALGDDYHDRLKDALFRAADRLRADFPQMQTRAFVDTGPLNEKLLASRAGLGWQGKHTNFIDPSRGSYLFLGVLLVDTDLGSAPAQYPDRCGLCEACIPACPTGAIFAPYQLDARRCISYLTIELRGAIPRDLRPAIGNRIFGCDDCQEVCPWNRFSRRQAPEPFLPRVDLRTSELSAWLALDHPAWAKMFRRSAVKRARYEGFMRNVLVAAGNSRDPQVVPRLIDFLGHPEPLLRQHAAWALGQHAPQEGRVRRALREARERESDVTVSGELAQVLGEQGIA
jgi:epoxyqueuosine reductase